MLVEISLTDDERAAVEGGPGCDRPADRRARGHAPADTNRSPCPSRRSRRAGMIATSHGTRAALLHETTHATPADRVDAHGREGSQAALCGVRGRDRLLRTDRRPRQLRITAHLAARRANARRRTGRHAPALRPERRLGSTRPLSTRSPTRAVLAGRDAQHLDLSGCRQPARCGHQSGAPSRGRDPVVAFAECRRPAAGRFKVARAPFPRPRARFRVGRRPAFRATSTTGSPQGGNQR